MSDIDKTKMLLDMYSRLDKDDKEILILFLNNNRYNNIINLLGRQDREFREIIENSKKHHFAYDFAANIAGNLVTDSFFALMSRLFRH